MTGYSSITLGAVLRRSGARVVEQWPTIRELTGEGERTGPLDEAGSNEVMGLAGLTKEPKTERKVVERRRCRYNLSAFRPGLPRRFRLRPVRTDFIQVSPNGS